MDRPGPTECATSAIMFVRAALAVLLVTVPAVSALDVDKDIRQFCLDRWGLDQGLPQNSVQSIIQTRDGFLWLGTQEGLVRFDGVQFAVRDKGNTEALSSNHVGSLGQTPDGDLWIGTFGGGLVRCRGGRFSRVSLSDTTTNVEITSILTQDADSHVWVGTDQLGLCQVAGDEVVRYGREAGLPSDTVTSLCRDRQGALWAGTPSGLVCLLEGRHRTYTTRDGLPNDSITSLCDDREGGLWVGTARGLCHLQSGRFQSYSARDGLRDDLVRCVHLDRDENLWIGTNGGLYRYCRDRFSSIGRRDGLISELIECLFEDNEGSVWFGTSGGGLNRIREGKVSAYSSRDGFVSPNIYSICGDGRGGLWAGTYDGQVYRLSEGTVMPLDDLQRGARDSTRIRALCWESPDVLWIASERSFRRLRGGVSTTYSTRDGMPQSPVRVILRDRDGRVWAGTDGGGLACLQGGRLCLYTRADGLAGDSIRALLQDHRGDLWIGCYSGLSRFREGHFKTYTTADGLSSDRIRALHEDRDGTLWIGTYGSGLNRLRDGRVDRYTARDGLYNDVVFSILEDSSDRLWMSCNKGIYSVSKKQLDAFSSGRTSHILCSVYNRSDGMPASECNGGSPAGWKTDDGRLWFPTLEGIAQIDPSRIPVNTRVPPVVIDRIAIDGEPVDLSATITLSPDSQRFEIHYTALSFLAPEKVRFRYMLDGFDQTWVEAGTRRAAYFTRLPPGEYRFRVIACNNDNLWNREGASILVSQRPHFYETRLFYVACAAGLLLAFFLLYTLRVRQLNRRERILEARIEEALGKIKVISGLLPICASCKKIRDDQGYWNKIETYIREHSTAEFSHGICPECMKNIYPEYYDRVAEELKKSGAFHLGERPPAESPPVDDRRPQP